MSSKFKGGQFSDPKGALIEALPNQGLIAFTKGTPTASQAGWEKGALNFDITNGILYINVGSLTSATWTAVPVTGSTLAALTVTAGTITTLTSTTANLTKTNVGVGASTIALGTNSGTAAALPAGTAEAYPVTAADDTVGVRMSASDNVTGRRIFVGNLVSNKILKIYPPTGGTINGAAADAAYSTASGKGAVVVCLDQTANTNTGAFAAVG